MNENDDSASFPSPLSDPFYTFGEITKDEIWTLLDTFWLASSPRDRPSVIAALQAWGILQREPFVTWMREWAGTYWRPQPYL